MDRRKYAFSKPTENVTGSRGVFSKLEVLLLENVKANVSVEEELLNIQVRGAHFFAVSAWDQNNGLGNSSSELQFGSEFHRAERVFHVRGINQLEGTQGLSELEFVVEDVVLHGVSVRGSEPSISSVANQAEIRIIDLCQINATSKPEVL